MQITEAIYQLDKQGNKGAVLAVINGKSMSVPISVGNRHYAEVLRQVEAGTLTIEEAE